MRGPFPTRRAARRGQILLVVPLMAFVLVGMFMVAANASAMARARIHLQTVTDSAARAGAYVEAITYGSMAQFNDVIVACRVGQLIAAATLQFPLIPTLEGVIGKVQTIQDYIIKACPAVVVGAIVAEGYFNDGSITLPVPLPKSKIKPGLEKGAFGLRLLTDSKIDAQLIVVGFQKVAVPFTGHPLVSGDAENWMLAFSYSRPYWSGLGFSYSDDKLRSGDIGKGNAIAAMLIPGPFWDAKLAKADDLVPQIGKVRVVEQIANRFFVDGWKAALDEVVDMIKDKLRDVLPDWIPFSI